MRYFFDREGKYAGSSMQGWEVILFLCFPIALVLFFIFLPIFILHKYASREEDLKYEKEHPEITNLDSSISGWYPWHRNSVPYTIALIAWVIAFLISLS